MSLDISLHIDGQEEEAGGIYIRRNGRMEKISREEWDQMNPGREPVTVKPYTTDEVFSANITHNLGEMADRAGIYYALWRPEEREWKLAKDITPVLEEGLRLLKKYPEFFKEFDSENGWGIYEHFVPFVEEVLEACKKYPEARIEVSR